MTIKKKLSLSCPNFLPYLKGTKSGASAFNPSQLIGGSSSSTQFQPSLPTQASIGQRRND
jgi:hypothetical protein